MERLEKYYNQIKNSPVFYGMNDEELRGLLECFNARIRRYEKDEMIIRQGDMIANIYLILDGEVNIEKDSYWGRRIIISRLSRNDNLALSFVGSKDVESSVDAIAIKDTLVLILSYEKCTSMCQNACTRHKVLINNLFQILSKENIELIQKIENVSQKTIRDKLLTYLSNEAQKRHSNSFDIHFNRQDLADYLNVDRSAMSFELSKLQKEGLIEYDKNHFELLS
ncbi:TPA: Crp/Fnr family transcriptional regulator [Candidatus Gastranaerophilales bacterium HUM_18]|mgnify:FL=1|jgi:CRP-like cAMP-binding protein|nr:MAG TPA: Crp/Fnr family transcriptional regulator [Candidatus Gastranaerophilales bacterium HUM_18]